MGLRANRDLAKESDQYEDQCDEEQKVDKVAAASTEKAQEPENDQSDDNEFQHRFSPMEHRCIQINGLKEGSLSTFSSQRKSPRRLKSERGRLSCGNLGDG
jgi:hypothetical protein